MERNSLHGNNLGSPRNLGLTASPDREHRATQGQTGSGMRVEQVKNKVSKEKLKGLIDTTGDLSDKSRLKDFVIQHVPSGKHFNLVFSTLNSSKGFNVRDIATLYADNKEAADAAYISIVRDESLDDCLRKNAADAISSEDQQQNAYCYLLKTCEPSNSQMLTDLLMIIGDKNKQKQVCYDILERVLGDEHVLSEILYRINQEPDFENVLTQIIKNNINKTYIAIDCCLQYIKNLKIKQDVQALASNYSKEQEKLKVEFEMQKTILEIKQPTATVDGLRKKLTSIQNLATMPAEEKDDLYLHVIKVASVDTIHKFTTARNHILNPEKKDEAFFYLVKLKNDPEDVRTAIISNIKNQELREKLLAEIIQDPTENFSFRMNLCIMVFDRGLRNNLLQAFANDESIDFRQRSAAALQLFTSSEKDAILLKLSSLLKKEDLSKHRDLIIHMSNDISDTKDNLLLQCIQIELETPMNEHALRDPTDPNVPIVKLFRSLKSAAIIKDLAQELVQNPWINKEEGFYQVCCINHNLSELVVNAMNTSIDGLEGEALEGAKKMKLAAARALLNFDNENIDALTIILGIEAEGKDSPYALYATVLAKSKESVALEDVLAKKQEQLASILANGQKVCLSAGAYSLPAVMEAEWQAGFERVDFAYFTGVIRSVFQDCCAEIERGLNKTNDIAERERLKKAIDENNTLEGEYLKYFNEDGRSVLQNALNTKNTTSSHGNKMKAIALHIDKLRQEGKTADALTKLAELRENMQTCKGGDQQAIETAYMTIQLSEKQPTRNDEQGLSVERTMLKEATQKVLSNMFKMSTNEVFENPTDSREKLAVSFAVKLSEVLKNKRLLKTARGFDDTHTSLAILGIAGKEMGLIAPDRHPSFDPNCVCANQLIQDPGVTKAAILEAFTDTFTFENIWKVLGTDLWDSLATPSKLPLSKEELFNDEDCTLQADLSALSPQDPMASGVLAFITSIHEAKEALANTTQKGQEDKQGNIKLTIKQDILKLMDKKEYYYKDPEFGNDAITLYTGFSKEALARILQELDLLKVLP